MKKLKIYGKEKKIYKKQKFFWIEESINNRIILQAKLLVLMNKINQKILSR